MRHPGNSYQAGQTTLVALLGGQPQIVTYSLDLLLARGESIDRVLVVYLASEKRYAKSFRKLAAEFPGGCYEGRSLPVHPVPVRLGERPLGSLRSPQEIEAARRTLFELFRELKAGGERILLSITGGRRMLAVLAVSTAMRHFSTEDRIWHLYTPPELVARAQEGAVMHAGPDEGVQLIEVPLVPWAVYMPGLVPLLGNSPGEVRASGWQGEAERSRCRYVWEGLTRRQRDVLRELAVGRSRKQAAEHLGVTVATVDSHKTVVLNACRLAWMEEDVRFDTQFLRERFKPFLVARGEV